MAVERERPRISHCPPGQEFVRAHITGKLKPIHTPRLKSRCHCAPCRARRIWTPERRAAAGERNRARAAGGFQFGARKDGRPRRAKSDVWTPQQDAALDALLGQADTWTIAEILTERFGVARTHTAVVNRIKRRGLSLLVVRPWSRRELVRLLGVSDETLVEWIERGLLIGIAWRFGGGLKLDHVSAAYPRSAVERFVRAHPELLNADRVRDSGLRLLLRSLTRGRLTVSGAEASRRTGVPAHRVHNWCQEGRVPSAHKIGHQWRISLEDLPLLATLPDLRTRAARADRDRRLASG